MEETPTPFEMASYRQRISKALGIDIDGQGNRYKIMAQVLAELSERVAKLEDKLSKE